MNEQQLAALAIFATCIPILVLAIRFRAGKNLEAISGYNADRVADKHGFGQFVGNRILAIAVLIILLGAGILVLPKEDKTLLGIGVVVLLQVPLLSLLLGMSKFHRK